MKAKLFSTDAINETGLCHFCFETDFKEASTLGSFQGGEVFFIVHDDARKAIFDLINAVERYVRQDCSRSTLIWKKEHLKRLLENENDA